MSKTLEPAAPPLPFLSGLYQGHDQRDAIVFEPVREWFRPPADFSHGDEHLVAEIPKREGGDGNPCRIYESRMPARFYKLEVLDSENSLGEPTKGFTVSTGSGDDMGALVVKMALAVRDGMLGWDGRKVVSDSGAKQDIRAALQAREFYELSQAYRFAPITDPAGVVAAWEDLKEYIIKNSNPHDALKGAGSAPAYAEHSNRPPNRDVVVELNNWRDEWCESLPERALMQFDNIVTAEELRAGERAPRS